MESFEIALAARLPALTALRRDLHAHPELGYACGHDGHVACLLGAAALLAAAAEPMEGPVRFIFQPAEEGERGALRMCEEGALEQPHAAAVFAYDLRHIPGVFWRLGIAVDGVPALPLHHPGFDFPDAALAIGIRVHTAVATRFATWIKERQHA